MTHSAEGISHAPKIVTFSGIDGAGKTTQIDAVCLHLEQHGFVLTRVSSWDDVAILPRLRTDVSSKLIKQTPDPSQSISLRNDKNVRKWYLTFVRSIFYIFDTFSLCLLVRKLRRRELDFIIFDRYVYDLLVQVRAHHWWTRLYNRALIALAPTPYVAFLLDASPDDAFRRKPEYPLAFMHQYRRAFLDLCALVPELKVVAPGGIDDVFQDILRLLCPDKSLTSLAQEPRLSASSPP